MNKRDDSGEVIRCRDAPTKPANVAGIVTHLYGDEGPPEAKITISARAYRALREKNDRLSSQLAAELCPLYETIGRLTERLSRRDETIDALTTKIEALKNKKRTRKSTRALEDEGHT